MAHNSDDAGQKELRGEILSVEPLEAPEPKKLWQGVYCNPDFAPQVGDALRAFVSRIRAHYPEYGIDFDDNDWQWEKDA